MICLGTVIYSSGWRNNFSNSFTELALEFKKAFTSCNMICKSMIENEHMDRIGQHTHAFKCGGAEEERWRWTGGGEWSGSKIPARMNAI